MSRVPADTVLRRLAAVAVVALSLTGCGGDDEPTPGQATTPPAVTPSSPDTASTSTTPPQPTSPAAPDEAAAAETAPEGDDAAAQTPKPAPKPVAPDTPASAKKASSKASSNEEVASDMKKVHDALKAEDYDVQKPIVENSSGALPVGTTTTIIFFPSPRQAAEKGQQLVKAFENSPQFVQARRTANRLYLLSLPSKPTDEQIADFRKIRQIANGAV